jgi:leucyl aminopeptidase
VRGVTGEAATVDVDVLFIPVFGAGDKLADVAWVDAATRGEIARARGTGEFHGRLFDVFATPTLGDGVRTRRIALVGAGVAADRTPERWRRLAATSGYAARRFGADSCAFLVRGIDKRDEVVAAAQHAADGLMAADFIDASYRKSEEPVRVPRRRLVVVPGADQAAVAASVARGQVLAECANFARRLANEPANVLTTVEFASRVSRAATEAGLGVDVLDEKRIRELGMGLLLSVAQGSDLPPRVIVLRHEPAGAPASSRLALVGKAVTFDTGGVSIKPADGMDQGAAAGDRGHSGCGEHGEWPGHEARRRRAGRERHDSRSDQHRRRRASDSR